MTRTTSNGNSKERNKGGRPKLPDSEKRSYSIKVNFDRANYAKLVRRRKRTGRPLSEIVYELAVNGYVKEPVSKDVAITTQLGIQPLHTEKSVFPKLPKQFKALPTYLFRNVLLYCLRLVYHSRHIRKCIWICLFCIWLLTIATACFMAHDNAEMRKTIQSWEKSVTECER